MVDATSRSRLERNIRTTVSGVAPFVLKNANVLNVYTNELVEADIAVQDGLIVGLGRYRGQVEVDLAGRVVAPGLIDAHVHIESSQVTPARYAEVVVPRGVTTVITDPHEIANVAGRKGIEFMLDDAEGLPLDVRVMLPSCVPATAVDEAGATLSALDLAPLFSHPRVLGLAEMMNVPGLLNCEEDVIDKLLLAGDRPIDGHAPGFTGRELAACVLAGVATDHECTTAEEMRERLRLGQYVQIREGSAAQNLEALLPVVTPQNMTRVLFCTDDRDSHALISEGGVDNNVRKAIRLGLDPIAAVRLASRHTAEAYGLKEKGAIAPGKEATFVVLDALNTFSVADVYVKGELVASQGTLVKPLSQRKSRYAASLRDSVRIRDIRPEDLEIPISSPKARVIELLPQSLITRQVFCSLGEVGEHFVADAERSLLVTVERHGRSGRLALGVLKGYGIQNGAIAQTIAHDSHNVIAVGDNPEDLALAIQHLKKIGGGIALVSAGQVLADQALEIAGLMSEAPLSEIAAQAEELHRLAHQILSVPEAVDPFGSLSFMGLSVIPELKLTTRGLFEFSSFSLVDLFLED